MINKEEYIDYKEMIRRLRNFASDDSLFDCEIPMLIEDLAGHISDDIDIDKEDGIVLARECRKVVKYLIKLIKDYIPEADKLGRLLYGVLKGESSDLQPLADSVYKKTQAIGMASFLMIKCFVDIYVYVELYEQKKKEENSELASYDKRTIDKILSMKDVVIVPATQWCQAGCIGL